MNTFFIPTASKNIKIQKVKFDVGLSYEDCLKPVSTSYEL